MKKTPTELSFDEIVRHWDALQGNPIIVYLKLSVDNLISQQQSGYDLAKKKELPKIQGAVTALKQIRSVLDKNGKEFAQIVKKD